MIHQIQIIFLFVLAMTATLPGCNNRVTIVYKESCMPRYLNGEVSHPMTEDAMVQVASSPDGKFIFLSAHPNTTVIVWNVKEGKEERLLQVSEVVGSIAVSPNNRFLALLTTPINDSRYIQNKLGFGIKLQFLKFDGSTYAPSIDLISSDDKASRMRKVLISPDNKQVFISSGTVGKPVQQWDIGTSKKIRDYKGTEYFASISTKIALSHTGTFLITSLTATGKVLVWDTHSGEQVFFVQFEGDGISQVSFSVQGKIVTHPTKDEFSIMSGSRIESWDLKSKKLKWKHQLPRNNFGALELDDPLRSHSGIEEINSIAYGHLGRYIALTTNHKQLRFISSDNGQLITNRMAHWVKTQQECKAGADCTQKACDLGFCWERRTDSSLLTKRAVIHIVGIISDTLILQVNYTKLALWSC